MAVGLVVLFGVLFGLRALGVFPRQPGDDPEIAAVRSTLAALPTQQAAPAVQPTAAPTPHVRKTASLPGSVRESRPIRTTPPRWAGETELTSDPIA